MTQRDWDRMLNNLLWMAGRMLAVTWCLGAVSAVIFRTLHSGGTARCAILQIKKPRSEGLKLLVKGRQVWSRDSLWILSNLQSWNLVSILLFWWKSKGIFFFFFGLDQRTMWKPWTGKVFYRKPPSNSWNTDTAFPHGMNAWMCMVVVLCVCVLFLASHGYKLFLYFGFPHLKSIRIKPLYLWV